jgi:hypothetical protein
VQAFDEASGNQLWSWTPSASSYTPYLEIIAATAGGGVAVREIATDGNGNPTSQGEDVVRLDSNGNATYDSWGTSGGTSGFGVLADSTYYGHGLWVGTTADPVVAGVMGDIMFDALGPWAWSGGGSPEQHSSPLPIFANFETTDPNPSENSETEVLANELPSTYTSSLFSPLGTATRPYYFLKSDATQGEFEIEIGRNIQGIAFIGHSYPALSIPNVAVGLCFWGYCAIPDLVLRPGESIGNTSDPQGDVYEVGLAGPWNGQARVVFISACDLTSVMQDWFGINSQTQHRVLIAPKGAVQVDMYMGQTAWLFVAQALSRHLSVATAVKFANQQMASINWVDSKGNKLPVPTWYPIGDSTITF